MSAIGKPLNLRLFLEGIEIPCVSANVSIGVNAPAAASIQAIPADEGLVLHPRTMVHLFFLADTVIEVDGVRGAPRKLTEYKLLFSGEMIAYQFQQTPQSRGLVLQCVDFSSYWDSAHATAIEYGPGGNWATHSAGLNASNAALFDDIVSQIPARLAAWLRDTPKTPGLSTIDGLAGGIIRILEAVGGVPGYERGINDFFTVAELRCHLLQQIIAEENDNTARRLIEGTVFDEWLRNGLQNMGQQVTFRDIIKLLFQYIYYEMVPNPVAKYSSARKGKLWWREVPPTTLSKMASGASAYATLTALYSETTTKLMGSSEFSQLMWEGYLRSLTDYVSKVIASLKGVGGAAAADSKRCIAKLEEILAKAKEAAGKVPDSWKNDYVQGFSNLLGDAAKIINDSTLVVKSAPLPYSDARLPRLHSQIFRPDCWFSPPPVCNVVFPEQFASLQYERNYMGEVTRTLVLVYNTIVGQDKLLATRILAPNTMAGAQSLIREVGRNSYRLLMPHEYHTGIVPREEWLPNTASTGSETDASKREASSGARVSWAQRVALFNFYKYRFANRSAQVGGRFNPGLVCGFPALVIRAPYYPNDQEQLKAFTETTTSSTEGATHAEMLKALLNNPETFGAPPVHLLGMIGSLSHSVGQDGGTSTFTMHHVRHHDGKDDEFLRLAKGAATIQRNIRITLSVDTINAMKSGKEKDTLLAFMAGITPQKVAVSKARVISKVSSTGGETEESAVAEVPPPPGTTFATFRGERGLTPAAGAVIVRGVPGPFKRGTVSDIEVVDATIVALGKSKAFASAAVTIMIDVPVTNEVPTEEIIRPRSWFSKKYANDLIGRDIYQHFFGCGSIVDELRIALDENEIIESPDDAIAQVEAGASGTDFLKYVDALTIKTSKVLTHTIERSANYLAYAYGQVKRNSRDVESFIQQYTYRPIATRTEMFGDDDLEFSIEANGKATPLARTSTPAQAQEGEFSGWEDPRLNEEPTYPFVGFHTSAIHPQLVTSDVPLAGLVEDMTLRLPRINADGARTPILTKFDMRQEKWSRVMAYYDALMRARAFRG